MKTDLVALQERRKPEFNVNDSGLQPATGAVRGARIIKATLGVITEDADTILEGLDGARGSLPRIEWKPSRQWRLPATL